MTRLLNRRPRRAAAPTADGDNGDQRPAVAIGHVPLTGDDIGDLARFYTSIGLRKVVRLPGVAILELRGGTHLAITRGPAGSATLDLMVDDVDATREHFVAIGAAPTDIRRAGPHRRFTATDPEGNTLVVNSSHVAGPV
ncbi:MAG: VOC family protein [Actinomycetota bacterium]